MQFFWQLLTCRRARLALLSQCLGSRSIQVTVLLLLSHLVVQLHLDRLRLIQRQVVLPQVYLVQLKRRLASLSVVVQCLDMGHLQLLLLVVQCLHLGHLQLRFWVIFLLEILIFFHFINCLALSKLSSLEPVYW